MIDLTQEELDLLFSLFAFRHVGDERDNVRGPVLLVPDERDVLVGP